MKNKRTVLLVEDDPYFAESIIQLLKSSGFDILISSTLAETKQLITHHQPSAVVVDVMLPPGPGEDPLKSRAGFTSGLTLAEWIATEHPEMPFIGYSSVSNPEFVKHFRRYGGQYLTKLAPRQHLVRALRAVLRTRKQKTVHESAISINPPSIPPRVFIVHGHDEKAKWELKNYLQNTLGFPQPIILHEQPNLGRTIIEKFEESAEQVGLVFVLLTPDDDASTPGGGAGKNRRARQNVIFEMGFFLGLLGRRRGKVLLLAKGDVGLPSDIAGCIYIDISRGIEAAGEAIRREVAQYVTRNP